MFEISVKPEVSKEKVSSKTPDSVIIVREIKKSGTKAMRKGLKDLENGTKVLDITKKFIDARHGKVTVNYRFDFITYEEIEKREEEINSRALIHMNEFESDKTYKPPVVVGTGPAGL